MPIIEVMAKKHVLVVTEAERLPDFEYVQVPAVTSMEEAFQIVRDRYGPDMKVGNFPYGKWIVPSQMPIKEFTGRHA